MGRRAQPNLALAASRPGGREDTLTEVFAGVLASDQELARWVMRQAGVDLADAARVEITTQIFDLEAGRVDMELRSGGRRVWSEHKIDAVFQPDQLGRYARAKEGEHGVVIVPRRRADEAEAELPLVEIRVLTWEEVAEHCKRPPDGSEQQPASAVAKKARDDLYGYLEEEGLTVQRKIDAQDVEALSNCNWILSKAIPGILDQVESEKPEGWSVREKRSRPLESWGRADFGFVTLEPDAAVRAAHEGRCWVTDAGGYFEVLVAGQPTWQDQAAVGVGATFHWGDLAAGARQWLEDADGEERLSRAGFQRIAEDWGVRAFRALPLIEIPGDTLDDQAGWIKDQAFAAFDDLIALQGDWVVVVGDGTG